MRRVLIVAFLLMAAVAALPAFAQNMTPTPTAASPAADRVDGGSIAVGDTIDGSLTFAEPAFVYTLESDGETSLSLALTSDDFDSYLTVEDESGNIVAFNDDSNGERNSRIVNLLLSAGTYSVIAESYGHYVGSGTQEGDFTLAVTESVVRRMEYTQTIDGELTSDEMSQDYIFSGSAGDTVVINMNSDAFDSYLRLLDSNGSELITNDDSGGTLNSQIGPYALSSTGSFTIRASSLNGSSTGVFTLSLNRVESQAIAYGDSVEVEFTDRDREFYFSFTGTYGDIVSITASSDQAVNTSVALNDPYNYQVAFDDDSGSGFDPELLGTSLTGDGLYTIALRAVDSNNGTVTLKLNSVPPKSLDDGTQTISFSSSTTQVPLTFDAEAGQTYRLTLNILGGVQSSSLSLSARQNGSSVMDTSSYNVSSVVVDFSVPTSGAVQVLISEYSYSNTQIEVSVAAVE